MDRQEKVLARLKGPVVPVNICFNEDGSVNYGAVRAYVDWLCEKEIPVILLTGGSSEFPSLSDEEIFTLTSEVCEAVDGRSVFMASTGTWKPALTCEFLRHADGIGVDVVKVQFGGWKDLAAEQIIRYFDLIEGAADIPLFTLAGPSTDAHIAAVAELARRPRVIGIKNDGTPFHNYYDLIRTCAATRILLRPRPCSKKRGPSSMSCSVACKLESVSAAVHGFQANRRGSSFQNPGRRTSQTLSSAEAACSTAASSKCRPTNCTPIGSPSEFQKKGTEMAAQCVGALTVPFT